jgi:hypothetical protein
MTDNATFLRDAVHFVRFASMTGLSLNNSYFEKQEAGGASHVGTADLDNTARAYEAFAGLADLLVVEEDLPSFAEWTREKTVILVDPLDGSAELGCGGSQFAAAVMRYGINGVPICGAVACPGLRPVFRLVDGNFEGFDGAMGTILFGGRDGVFILPMFPSTSAADPIRVPLVCPAEPGSHRYTNVALDLNLPSICGLGRHVEGVDTALARMPFSNIFAQCQVVLGHANAMTLGPSQVVESCVVSGAGISGPKAWDLILPITLGVGLSLVTLAGREVSQLVPEECLDSYVLRERLILSHPDVGKLYEREIERLRR